MDRLAGVLLVVLSAILIGGNPVLAKIVYRYGMDPLSYLFIRFAISSAILLAVMRVKRTPWPRGPLCRSLLGLGVWGMCGTALCYFYALQNASPGLVTVLVFSYPALVVILGVVFFKRRLTLLALTALALTLGGVILTVGPGREGHTTGVLLSLCAAVLFAAYITFGSVRIRQAGFLPAATVVNCAATFALGLGVLVKGITWPTTPVTWGLIAASAVMSSFLGRLAFNAGLERIEAPTAAMLSTVELVVAVGLSVVFLGDALAPHTVTGAALILGATLLLTRMEMRVARTAPAAVVLDDTAHPAGYHPVGNGRQIAARWVRRVRSGARGVA